MASGAEEEVAGYSFEPIGYFHCAAQHPYDAARQPACAQGGGGCVELLPGRNFEQALQDLDGFSRVWLIYVFHRNLNWKPLVLPPRTERKVGVFASRAPYRPNPVGMSCVPLLGVRGLRVEVGAHDLLEGTPILDIKPYLPYADSHPEESTGWLAEVELDDWDVTFSPEAEAALVWLEERGVGALRGFLLQQLRERPFDTKRKRVREVGEGQWEIAYRTWRVGFSVARAARRIVVEGVRSGYSGEGLRSSSDRYGDKEVHRDFNHHAARNHFRS